MEFSVPKFIERQPVIVFGITFRQFMFLGVTALGLGILWLTLPSKFLFWVITSLTALFAFLAIFVKIGGRPFSTVLFNFFRYTLGPKLYLWERKGAMAFVLKKVQPERKKEPTLKEITSESSLRIVERSHLGEMARRVETGT